MEESSELAIIIEKLSDADADRVIAFALALMLEQTQVTHVY